MIHTAEIQVQISAKCFTAFKRAEGTRYHRQEHRWVNKRYKRNGIVLYAYRVFRPNYTAIVMRATVNLAKLVHRRDSLTPATMFDFERVWLGFDSIMEHISCLIPHLEYWKATRIDYSFNATTEYVEEYIRLLHKADRRGLQDWYDATNHHRGQKPGSLYLVSMAKKTANKSFTINFYDKRAETLAKHPNRTKDLPANILRLEIQCHRAKLRAIREKYDLDGQSLLDFYDWQIAEDLFLSYLKKLCVESDYTRKQEALGILAKSNLSVPVQERCSAIIEAVSKQHSSIAKAREKLVATEAMTEAQFDYALKMLKKLALNPVVISERSKIKHLPSIRELFSRALYAEMYLDA